jgi:hypothetical protein
MNNSQLDPNQVMTNAQKLELIKNSLTIAKDKTIAKSTPYRIFLEINKLDVPWDNKEQVAMLLSKRFAGLDEDTPSETLVEVAKLVVDVFTATYYTVSKDLANPDSNTDLEKHKVLTNRVFMELLR